MADSLFKWGRTPQHKPLICLSMVIDQAESAKTPPEILVERSLKRKEQNLEVAQKVANGELRPLVVSFSQRIRKEMYLPARYRHIRLFVAPAAFESLEALQNEIRMQIPLPLSDLPLHAYDICRRLESNEGAEAAGESETAGDLEREVVRSTPIGSDEALKEEYRRIQASRESGVGKMRVVVEETEAFYDFLAERRGYKTDKDGALPDGRSPQDATGWMMISFYKLHEVADRDELTNRMKAAWEPLGVLGRVYVASEGINAQVAVPNNLVDLFEDTVTVMPELEGVYLNKDEPVGRDVSPFSKLQIKPRKQVLADGLDKALDWQENGKKLSPEQWHTAIQGAQKGAQDGPVLLDVRNFYESKVGYFEGSQPLDTVTFRDTWGAFEKALQNVDKNRSILTYCTGGIRCEKANAYLIQEMGYQDVGALQGGIVNYAQYVTSNNLTSRFLGVNHVFDQRLGQRVGDKILSKCEFCGVASDVQTDCVNAACPRPFSKRRFVQCGECAAVLGGGCCFECQQEAEARASKQNLLQEAEVLRKEISKARANARGKKDQAYVQKMMDVASNAEIQLSALQKGVEDTTEQIRMLHTQAVLAVGETGSGAAMDQQDSSSEGDDMGSFSEPLAISSSPSSSSSASSVPFEHHNHLGAQLDALANYAQAFTTPEHPFLREVREKTLQSLPGRSHMLSGVVQAQLLSMLVAISGAQKVLEIGCFTGYSALALASGLNEGGKVMTIEKDPEIAQVASGHFKTSPWSESIDIRVGDGMEVLSDIETSFDLVFLDANKKQYENYLRKMLDLGTIRVGGLLVVDNVLWKGRVLQLQDLSEEELISQSHDRQRKGAMSLLEADKYAIAMHKFNEFVRDDKRVDVVMLPVRDGLSIIRRVS